MRTITDTELSSSELTERVSLRATPIVVDAIGGQTEGVPIVFASNVPAAVDALDIGSERIQIGQLRSSVSKLVRMRYRADVSAGMSVLWLGLVLEIGAADRVGHVLRLYCAEVMA